jgi:hypothetical protein
MVANSRTATEESGSWRPRTRPRWTAGVPYQDAITGSGPNRPDPDGVGPEVTGAVEGAGEERKSTHVTKKSDGGKIV